MYNSVQVVPLSRISLAELLNVDLESSEEDSSPPFNTNDECNTSRLTNSNNSLTSNSPRVTGQHKAHVFDTSFVGGLSTKNIELIQSRRKQSQGKIPYPNIDQDRGNHKIKKHKTGKKLWLKSCLCSIRSKTLLSLLTSILGLMIVLACLLILGYSLTFNKLGHDIEKDSVLRVMFNIFDDFDRTLDKQMAYGEWDVLYDAFIPGSFSFERLDAFIAGNFFPEYMQLSHKVNFVGFYFLNGTLARSVGIDLNTLESLDYPEELHYLPPGHPLNIGMDILAYRNGGFMVLSSGDVLLTTSTPIFDALRNATDGMLVYGRLLDSQKLQEVAQRSQLCLTLASTRTIHDSKLKERVRDARSIVLNVTNSDCEDCEPFYTSFWNTNSKDTFSGGRNRVCWSEDSGKKKRTVSYFVDSDMFGQKAVVFRIDQAQTLVSLAARAFMFCYGVVCIIVLIIALIVVIFTELTVLRPISQLIENLSNIVQTNDISSKIKLVDYGEIGVMTQSINGLLLSLQNTLQTSLDEKDSLQNVMNISDVQDIALETVMNQLDHIIILVSMSGAIVRANHSFYTQLGHDPSSGAHQDTMMLPRVLGNETIMRQLAEECERAGNDECSFETDIRGMKPVTGTSSFMVRAKKLKAIVSGPRNSTLDKTSNVYLLIAQDMEDDTDDLRAVLKRHQEALASLQQHEPTHI